MSIIIIVLGGGWQMMDAELNSPLIQLWIFSQITLGHGHSGLNDPFFRPRDRDTWGPMFMRWCPFGCVGVWYVGRLVRLANEMKVRAVSER